MRTFAPVDASVDSPFMRIVLPSSVEVVEVGSRRAVDVDAVAELQEDDVVDDALGAGLVLA